MKPSHCSPNEDRGHKATGSAHREANSLRAADFSSTSLDESPDRASAEPVITTSGVVACRRPRPSEVTANVVFLHSPTRADGQCRSITGGPAETRSSRERSQSRATPQWRNVPFSQRVLALSGGPSHRTAAARTGRVWVLLERTLPTS